MTSLQSLSAAVVPAFNAAPTLNMVLKGLKSFFPPMQIIVVDDGSTDATCEIANSAGVVVLRHERNAGKGRALASGFAYARKNLSVETVLTLDADMQHAPSDIPLFFEEYERATPDLIIGYRKRIGVGMPLHRILSNTLTSALVSARTGLAIRDSQCGFRLIRTSVLEEVGMDSPGYEAETEFLIRAAQKGFVVSFVAIQTLYGAEKSAMTNWTTTRRFINVLFHDYS